MKIDEKVDYEVRCEIWESIALRNAKEKVALKNVLSHILAELEADPNDGGQSRLSDDLVERIKKVLEK